MKERLIVKHASLNYKSFNHIIEFEQICMQKNKFNPIRLREGNNLRKLKAKSKKKKFLEFACACNWESECNWNNSIDASKAQSKIYFIWI